MKISKLSLATAMLAAFISNTSVQAAAGDNFPIGLWNTEHYLINQTKRTVPVKIAVCIKADGTWQSLNSTDGMGGRWTRSGNNVNLTGNGKGLGGTGAMTLVVPYRLMTGTWQSWSLDTKDKQHFSYTSKWNLANSKSCDLTQ